MSLENEIAKCLKIVFNSTVCFFSARPSSSLTSDLSYRVREAIRLNGIITPIVYLPHLPTRKLICEVLSPP
jgi:cytokinesis protein